MQVHHATSRTAVPEVIAGKRAEDTLEAFSAIQRITQFLTVDVQRISVANRNLLDSRE